MKPYYEHSGITIYHGDCREVLPCLAAGVADVCITDPPFGVNKAEWDDEFPLWWLDGAAHVTKYAAAVMPGIDNVLTMPRVWHGLVYRWLLSIHITNGMTRGRMGFGNWIPAIVYARDGVSLYRAQQDAGAVPVQGDMPGHPSPKPLRAMTWLVSRFDPSWSVLDPFMGSGTTLDAAKRLGRRAIGIELEERYCEIAARRLEQEVMHLEELSHATL